MLNATTTALTSENSYPISFTPSKSVLEDFGVIPKYSTCIELYSLDLQDYPLLRNLRFGKPTSYGRWWKRIGNIHLRTLYPQENSICVATTRNGVWEKVLCFVLILYFCLIYLGLYKRDYGNGSRSFLSFAVSSAIVLHVMAGDGRLAIGDCDVLMTAKGWTIRIRGI